VRPARAGCLIARAAAIVALVAGTVAAPRAAGAQTEPRVPWIGYLANEPTPDSMPVLRQGLRERGWIEGQHVRIWYRYAQGRFDLFPGHVDELVRLGVNAIVAASPPAVEAARRATRTIPIVMVTTDDPVANGLVAAPGRAEGNLTGLSLFAPELAGRRLELLKRAVPGAARVAVVWNPSNPTCALELRASQVAARVLGIELMPIELKTEGDLRVVRGAIKNQQPDGLLVLADLLTVAHRSQLTTVAARSRVPAVFPLPEFVDAGGLMAYGPSWGDAFRRAAVQIDRILRGAPPADLPVERPSRFELHVNLKAARALELPIPSSLLVEATRVLQ
jgi:putative ABC transport system substrate-binding protein